MSSGIVAAGAAAVALYVYLKQKGLQDGEMDPVLPIEACRDTLHSDHAPSNWSEALFHVKEVLRYMYNETLGRWHTIDLFVGLAYLSHREAPEYPALDIALKGAPVEASLGTDDQLKLLLELQEARRYMLYCKGLKLRREDMQARFWREHLGADTLTIVKQQPTAGVLRPAYVLVSDRALRAVVLCIRGTHSMKDLFTSLAGAAKPHHVVDPGGGGLVLGYSHLGMLAAARWLARHVTPLLRAALDANPGYCLRIVGHSMGGGTAALLTMMLRGGYGGPAAAPAAAAGAAAPDPLREARCYAIACPSVVTLELAAACREYVTSIVNGTDIVPTFCAASVDRLREDVTRSSWFSEFSRDMRSGVLRALQGGVRGVGSATQWTSRNILQPAVVPFRACYTSTAAATRRTRRRAAAASALTGAAAGASSAANMALAAAAAAAAAEQHEQLLLAAGAGGGAAAAAAAAVAAAALSDIGSVAGGLTPVSEALAASSGPGPGGPLPPPLAQTMSLRGSEPLGSGPGAAPGPGGSAAALRGGEAFSEAGLDERAMAEAVQSCMYAVGSAVSAQVEGGQSPADPAMAEALELLDSLPRELGPGAGRGAARQGQGQGRGAHGPHAPRRAHSGGGAAPLPLDASAAAAAGTGGAEPAGNLLTGVGAAVGVFGSGGVSTALSYGSSLRRRLWPWGQGAQGQAGVGAWEQDGGGGEGSPADVSDGGGAFSAPVPVPVRRDSAGCLPTSTPAGATTRAEAAGAAPEDAAEWRRSGGGGGAAEPMTPPHLIAFDSPGKAKAAAAATVVHGPGGGVPTPSGRGLGDWLWRGSGMLFTSCTTPRRPGPGPGQAGQAARWPGLGLGLGPGAGSSAAGGAGDLEAAAGRRPLRMDVGAGYDDESDDDMLEGSGSEGAEDDGDLEGEEEDDGMGGGQGGPGGAAFAGGGAADPEQQLQAGITAVVAAVTNQASREAEGPAGLMRDEAACAAEDVLREAEAGEAAEAEAPSPAGPRRRARRAGAGGGSNGDGGAGRRGLSRRSRRSIGAAAGGAGATAIRSASMPHGVEALEGGGAAAAVGPGGGGGVGAAARGLARAVSELARGAMASERGEEEGITSPLSPGGGGSPVGSGLPGRSADHEARLYKRKLYPAGRILHLFPAAALAGLQRQHGAATAEADGGSGGPCDDVNATAAAASTTPADAAAARSSAAQAPYVLYEVPDPTAYSRVRLCRTMVSDHLIPAYLTALESVMGALGEEQQRAAREAWEREQAQE